MFKMLVLVIYVIFVILLPLQICSMTIRANKELKEKYGTVRIKKNSSLIMRITADLKLVLMSIIPIVNVIIVLALSTEEAYKAFYRELEKRIDIS